VLFIHNNNVHLLVLTGATELDVDALCDKNGDVTICGIMEHIEEAGVHSGDSACSLPPQTVPEETLAEMRDWTTRIAKELKVVGLINVQYCIKGGDLYIIEANPRASRTVPFVAKAVGHPIAAYASLIMSGKTLKELNFTEEPKVCGFSSFLCASEECLCRFGVLKWCVSGCGVGCVFGGQAPLKTKVNVCRFLMCP
jgi:carbamoylphosphate synthase large subunit